MRTGFHVELAAAALAWLPTRESRLELEGAGHDYSVDVLGG